MNTSSQNLSENFPEKILPDNFFSGRITNFLRFKNISFENNNINIFPKTSAKSLTILREIEENQPFPIGFVGPLESTLQWASIIISTLPEFSPEMLEPIFEEITEKVEDEFFLMGPTFTVADCVLASDLQNILCLKNQKNTLVLPKQIQTYIKRVEENIL